MAYSLQRWTPDFPTDDGKISFSSIMIAMRRSGKSTLIKYLYKKYLKDKFDRVYVYTNLPGVKYYSTFIPKQRIYTEFKPQRIKRLMNANIEAKRKLNILIVFDDTSSIKEKYNAEILDLYIKGRHFGISVIYSTQMATLVSPAWKYNSDLIFIFRQKSFSLDEYIINTLLKGTIDLRFDTRKEEFKFYRDIIDKATREPYSMLIKDSKKDQLFTYKGGI